jgi:hypothetical protein
MQAARCCARCLVDNLHTRQLLLLRTALLLQRKITAAATTPLKLHYRTGTMSSICSSKQQHKQQLSERSLRVKVVAADFCMHACVEAYACIGMSAAPACTCPLSATPDIRLQTSQSSCQIQAYQR